jgi:hypothetical protein
MVLEAGFSPFLLLFPVFDAYFVTDGQKMLDNIREL